MVSYALNDPSVVPPFALRGQPGLAGFTDSAVAAIDGSPDYFAVWYTVKSIALVVAVAVLAYNLGKDAGRKARSEA